MKTNEYMEQTEQYVLHTYNRFPLVIDLLFDKVFYGQRICDEPWYEYISMERGY